jgi:tetratricopeptide (TPR) repeat protein
MRRLTFLVAAILGLAVALGVGYRVHARRSRDVELAQARRELEGGRAATARRRLESLAKAWPDDGEVLFRLGICEQALGRFDAADSAWSRVGPESPFAAKAATLRADDLINAGRYGEAEALLLSVLTKAGADRYEVERALIRLYRFEGRVSDVRRLLKASIPHSPDPGLDLKELWLLDNSPMPVEALGLALERADDSDDRVWLGRANHAILVGRHDDARKLLEACFLKRPDDPPLWRARLDLAVASDDASAAWDAARHIPSSDLTPRELAELRRWLIARPGGPEAETRAWVDLLEREPSHPQALERLAALAAAAGKSEDRERYQRLKMELDRDKDRFRDLLLAQNLEADAAELAEIAKRLGNEFEARAWSLLARHGRAGWAAASRSLAEASGEAAPPRIALAEALAELQPNTPSRAPELAGNSPPTPPRFTDDAEAAGLRFTYDHGASPNRLLPETMSGGVATLDYDGDGWVDIYVVQGGPLDDEPSRTREPGRLFRNRGDGTFEDVTEPSGIAALPRSYDLGATVGDYDNDGDPDLFVSRLRSYLLIRNRGDGTFEDATEESGLAGLRHNPTSAAFADLDGDGDLDLYVCHYMVYDPAHPVQCKNERGEFFYCDPSRVEAAPDRLFRNDGGRFVDVTDESGIVDREGRGLGVVAADLDDDGRTDLYVANDGTANYLFRNLGGFKFEEVGLTSGVAGSGEGGYQASMGVACGDLDRDGLLDLVVTNFYGECSTLYRNLGHGLFTDWTGPSRLGPATRYLLGFGTSFLDYDNDGRIDLATTYGHVNDNRPFYPYAMPSQLLAGTDDGRLVDVSTAAGPPWTLPRVGRGLAVADLDNDGREDLLILPQGETLAYFHNRTAGGHSLTLHLVGNSSNRDAVGARVTVLADGLRQVAERFGGGSYQSAGDFRLHFGLGPSRRVEQIDVRWPSGRVDHFKGLEADAAYRLTEGNSTPSLLPKKGTSADDADGRR